MVVHLSHTRGHADHGWLKTYHTFSFADYYDPQRMGFGALRVLNDDYIAPGMGFSRHPHKNMEIITIPLKGVLKHQDSEGNSSEISKGEVQIMSAGTGIFHSEANASGVNPVELLQIWVLPKTLNISPRYEQKKFELNKNEIKLIVSPQVEEGAVYINQDAYFYLLKLEQHKEISFSKKLPSNGLYIFVIGGEVQIGSQNLKHRDALGITDIDQVFLKAFQDSDILLMEVPI